jgi:6,7-dimethyl-8-ribityllumazine synthase
MASNLKDLSTYDRQGIPSAVNMKFGIVVSEWNEEITQSLLKGALKTLIAHGAKKKNIIVHYVPGSFELPLGAEYFICSKDINAVICLGCIIQGETRHFEFICNAVANGIMKASQDNLLPVIFGVLTTNTLQQAKDRAGGKHGNKGIEAAITAIKMVALDKELINDKE